MQLGPAGMYGTTAAPPFHMLLPQPVDARPSRKRTKAGRYATDVSYEELQQKFHLPTKQACKELGLGLTVFKRICRRFGLVRWPYRKISVLQHDRSEDSSDNSPHVRPARRTSSPTSRRSAGRAGGSASRRRDASPDASDLSDLSGSMSGELCGQQSEGRGGFVAGSAHPTLACPVPTSAGPNSAAPFVRGCLPARECPNQSHSSDSEAQPLQGLAQQLGMLASVCEQAAAADDCAAASQQRPAFIGGTARSAFQRVAPTQSTCPAEAAAPASSFLLQSISGSGATGPAPYRECPMGAAANVAPLPPTPCNSQGAVQQPASDAAAAAAAQAPMPAEQQPPPVASQAACSEALLAAGLSNVNLQMLQALAASVQAAERAREQRAQQAQQLWQQLLQQRARHLLHDLLQSRRQQQLQEQQQQLYTAYH